MGLDKPSCVLVIDDNTDMLEVVSSRLRSWGYGVLTAASGEEGIRLAEQHVPDIILLDVVMPRMKGREVCMKLKATDKTQQIPVIFLTVLGLADHVKAGLDVGAEDYIVKPFEPDVLRERIRVCLARYGKSEPPKSDHRP